MKYFLLALIVSFSLLAQEDQQQLVCIHGFLGATWNMHLLSKNFTKKGWDVTNWGYSSREKTIKSHSKDLVLELCKLAKKQPGKAMDFLAHSMGCLVLRAALNHPDCPHEAKIGKAVLLAPPNKGSAYAQFLNGFSLIRSFAKEMSGKELLTEGDFEHLGQMPSSMENVLVIAGNGGYNPVIVGENDGTVAVSETCLSTPHQHIVLNTGHKTILFNKDTFINAYYFLK